MKLKPNKVQTNKFVHNLQVFFTPVAIMYIVAVVGVITANDGAFTIEAFIPNTFVLGGMTLYVLNTILDYLRKVRK